VEQGPESIDLGYLRSLSADAVPAAEDVAEPARSAVLGGKANPGPDGWAGWNLGRARAVQVRERTAP